MKGNPGWLKPLRRLLSRVDVPALFHSLDRGEGATAPPAHQELVSQLLHALQNQRITPKLSAILTDIRWIQVRSSAPLQSWEHALRKEGIEPMQGIIEDRRRVAIEMLRAIGARGQDKQQLRRSCIWLAPSMYTVGLGSLDAQPNDIFSCSEPLSRRYVSLIADGGDLDSWVTQVGDYQLVTSKGVIHVKQGSGQHIGTVNMGRWRMLAEGQDRSTLIQSLPGWIAQVESEERTRGVPSHQLWLGICRDFRADVIIGCSPLVAPAARKLCGRE